MPPKESPRSRWAEVGFALLFVGTCAAKLLAFFSDVQSLRGVSVGVVTIPAEFVLLMGQYLALMVGSILVAPAIASLVKNALNSLHERRSNKRHARQLLPHVTSAQLGELKKLLDAPAPADRAWLQSALAYKLVDELVRTGLGESLFELRSGVRGEIEKEISRRDWNA